MSIWSKLLTALRGGANEAGEAIAETQALRILDQEIRDTTEAIKNSKHNLAELMAGQKVAEHKCTILNAKIAQYEDYAIQALDKNDESLAKDLAEKIADLEEQYNTQQIAYDELTSNVDGLRLAIKQADSNITHLKHQVDSAKATKNVQQAQAVVTRLQSDSKSKLSTALDSLERIKEKQEFNSARIIAKQSIVEGLTGDSLNDRLEAAGIVTENQNGEAVLTRLKNKTALRLESDSRSNQEN